MTPRRALCAAALTLSVLAPTLAFAQDGPNQLGVGAYLGTPFGFTAEYLIDGRNAVDFAIGAQGDNLDAHFDVLTHFRGFPAQPPSGRLAPYLGLGLKIEAQEDTLVGVRFMGGLAYQLPGSPVELFAELVPVLRLAPSVGSNLDGGVGLRYFFGGGATR